MFHLYHDNIQNILADRGYSDDKFAKSVYKILHCPVEIAKGNTLHTFSVIPKRSVIERSFASFFERICTWAYEQQNNLGPRIRTAKQLKTRNSRKHGQIRLRRPSAQPVQVPPKQNYKPFARAALNFFLSVSAAPNRKNGWPNIKNIYRWSCLEWAQHFCFIPGSFGVRHTGCANWGLNGYFVYCKNLDGCLVAT